EGSRIIFEWATSLIPCRPTNPSGQDLRVGRILPCLRVVAELEIEDTALGILVRPGNVRVVLRVVRGQKNTDVRGNVTMIVDLVVDGKVIQAVRNRMLMVGHRDLHILVVLVGRRSE